MQKLVVIGFVAATAFATKQHPINAELVKTIRERTSSWIAHDPETNPFRNYTIEKLRGMCGTIISSNIQDADMDYDEPVLVQGLPSSFDWRDQLAGAVHPIRDQKQCGSCWAFAATEAHSDRLFIHSQGAVDVVLSPQDMVSCDPWDLGCNGGILSFAWSYIKNTGVVADACIPYTSGDGTVASCPKQCTGSGPWTKYKCDGNVVSSSGPDRIQSDIFANGPVETGFTVYEDFMSYKSGIYVHTAGAQLGGHAVKIIGWGTADDGTQYWICANSWGTSWGEDGFFNIAFGQCGIDSTTYACKPKW